MLKQGNLSLLCDFYEMTMANGYYKTGKYRQKVYFDLFFRNIPDNGGFAVFAGLEDIVKYIENLSFGTEEIAYLRKKKIFDEYFLNYLSNFKFTGDIYCVPEGTPVFPNEPILTVGAEAIQAQIIETFLLLTVNHQSLIATKANRIVRAAAGRPVLELGARRAQGRDAAISGGRAAYIGGCCGTSCTLTNELYNVPLSGTMAHSWVQMFESEYEAFRVFCELYPQNTVLLIDTYDTLKSGLPNAIRAFKEILVPKGIKKFAVRLDSGDLSYLSKRVREELDKAGLKTCNIIASNSMDEYKISSLIAQNSKIDIFGVGERLITSKSSPVFGGVYKLVATETSDGKILPKIKLSENSTKITTPHLKKVYRFYDRKSGKALADQVCVFNEKIDSHKDLVIFDQNDIWKKKVLTDFKVRELQVPIFLKGKRVYKLPKIDEIRRYCLSEIDTLWDEVKRFEYPHKYYVDLSPNLWSIKNQMIKSAREKF